MTLPTALKDERDEMSDVAQPSTRIGNPLCAPWMNRLEELEMTQLQQDSLLEAAITEGAVIFPLA